MKNKHPYYDSDRKKETESFSLKMIGWTVITLILLYIIMSAI